MNGQYIYYAKLSLRLESILRIAGESEEHFELVTNGEGQYIIPATGIAGAMKHYLSEESKYSEGSKYTQKDVEELFGGQEHSSIFCFYDAECNNVKLEQRRGIRLNSRYGVAENRGLFSQYYIGQGMTCSLCMQAHVDEEKRELVQNIIQSVTAAIAGHRIVFGSKKSNGAGEFSVSSAKMRCLDLKNEEDRKCYLDNTELEIFEECKEEICYDQSAESMMCNEYSLQAKIPDGLLVKSGEREKGAAVNMSHEIEGEKVYYIPGSSIKGIIRSYAEKIADYLKVEKDSLTAIFGTSQDGTAKAAGENADRQAGSVYVSDCTIWNAVETPYNRIKVDRWLGSTISGAKMVENVISTKENQSISIQVRIDKSRLDENQWKMANAFVYLALRDLGIKRISLGSGNSVGYGRLLGEKLVVNGIECPIDRDQINIGECESEILGYLKALEV